jgi:hypothetical protein
MSSSEQKKTKNDGGEKRRRRRRRPRGTGDELRDRFDTTEFFGSGGWDPLDEEGRRPCDYDDNRDR